MPPLRRSYRSERLYASGDDACNDRKLTDEVGSPPRAWRRVVIARQGLIVARSPHGRGDESYRNRWNHCWFGSPPRAWGRHANYRNRARRGRFTPTRVGTTVGSPLYHVRVPVHPHARGDDVFSLASASSPRGSPPRAWGRRIVLRKQLNPRRFTPTRVGTTITILTCNALLPVHPHARGDDGATCYIVVPYTGSPPRAWGRRRLCRPARSRCRFTPTRVGTTQTLREATVCNPGSPPRAWGRRHCHVRAD